MMLPGWFGAPRERNTAMSIRITMLYQESGDIYLVADVLGHKDVNTTRKHYAAMTEEKSRMAAKYIKLRDDTTDSASSDISDSEK